MPYPIENGTFTVVNPRTGGFRCIRISDPDREYWKDLKPGMRLASYLSATDKWIGFAFVEEGGTARVWRKATIMEAEIAALNWLLAHGAGREEELRRNWDEVERGRESFEPVAQVAPLKRYEDLFPDDN